MPAKNRKSRAGLSLTAALATAFLALSVLALLISGVLQLFSSIQSQQEIIASKEQLIAQDAAKTVASFIQEKFGVLETTAGLANPAAATFEQQELILQKLLGLQPAFRQLAVLDDQYQEMAQASRFRQTALHLTDRLEGEIPFQMQQGQRYISPVYVDPLSSEPLVIMSVPVNNVLKEFQGTLVAEVNLKVMWDLVDQIEVGETGVAYVVDRGGNLIAFRDTGRVLKGENVSQLKPVSEFVNEPAAGMTRLSLYRGITGGIVVGTYAPLGTPDWAVVTEFSYGEAYRASIQEVLIGLGIMMAIALLAGLAAVKVARQMAVPLISLTDTATRIAGGEIELQAAVAGPQELASLATAFNSMTAQLRQTLEGLEHRVADRTRELQERNAQLQQAYRTLEESQTKLVISEKMASMGRLTAGIAHEMNTPLAAVRLALTELQKLTKEYQASLGDPEVTLEDYRAIAQEMHTALRMADSAAESAASFVRAIKTQTRDLAPHERQTFNAVAVIQEALSLFGYLAREAHSSVNFDPPSEDVYLCGSPGRLAQIVTNLVTNAIDATAPQGGGPIMLRLLPDDGGAILQVSDLGCGIPPDVLPKIFDPMFTTKPFGQGTGLGLTLVHDIVTGEFAGTIEVESQPGQGTTFTLHFPSFQTVMA